MIKFFRNIRRRLLRENRFARYLLYAIGEIILVVVGILIALQINNWNEANKNTAFEIKMLKELSVAMESDIDLIDNLLIHRIEEKENSVEYFKKLLKNDSVDRDSLNFYYNWLTTGILFGFNRGPYEGLKSMGLDRISNDSIRNQVQILYDRTLPRQQQLVEWVETKYGDEQYELLEQYRQPASYEIFNDKVHFKIPLVSKDFWEDSDFIRSLILAELRARYNRQLFEELRTDFIKMKAMIDLEVKNLEGF